MSDTSVMILRPKNEDFLTRKVLGSRETYSTFDLRRQKGIGQSSSNITNLTNQETQFQFAVNARQLGKGCFKYQAGIEATYTLGTDFQNGGGGVTDSVLIGKLKTRIGLGQYDINQCLSQAGLRINGGKVINSKPYKEAKYLSKTLDVREQVTQNPSAMYNPLNDYDGKKLVNPIRSSDDALQFSRGLGVVPFTVVNNDTGNGFATIRWDVSGTLILGGTQWFESAGTALDYPQVDNVQLDLTWGRDLRYALAIDPQTDTALEVTLTSGNVSVKNFELVTELKTPDMATAKIPAKTYFNNPHVQYRSNNSSIGTLASGADAVDVSVGDLNITQVPSLFIVRAYAPAAQPYLPEIELPITHASLTAGGSNQIFDSYNQRQLWEITSRNGYQGRHSDFYSQFANANGSCLIFTPSDLAQGIQLASNTAKSDTMEFRFSIHNHTSEGVDPIVEVAMVYDYYLTMDAKTNEYTELPATVSIEQLVKGMTQYTNLNFDRHVLGGGFGDFWRKYVRPVRKAVEPFTRNIPGAGVAHAIADSVGGGVIRTGGKAKAKAKGGRKMTAKQLKELI